MATYIITDMHQDTIDITQFSGSPERMAGQQTITIEKRDDKPGIFDTSILHVTLGAMPKEVQDAYQMFENLLVNNIRSYYDGH